jgi:hypothetical protein
LPDASPRRHPNLGARPNRLRRAAIDVRLSPPVDLALAVVGKRGELGEPGRLDRRKDEAVLNRSPSNQIELVEQELEREGVRCYEPFVETEGSAGWDGQRWT